MGCVVIDEVARQTVDRGDRQVLAGGRKAALKHEASAAADHVARTLIVDRRQAFARQDGVEGRDQVGRGVDQRSVKVEDDKGGRRKGGHPAIAIGRGLEWQALAVQPVQMVVQMGYACRWIDAR